MSSFKGKNLFGSGPHRFTVHGRSLRHAARPSPGGDGVQVTAQGRDARRVDQTGTLRADDVARMQAQLDAIEAELDGVAGELVDDRGRVYADVLMLQFAPGAIRGVGRRLALDYTIAYLQGQP